MKKKHFDGWPIALSTAFCDAWGDAIDQRYDRDRWRMLERAIQAMLDRISVEREACAVIAENFKRPHPVDDPRGMRPPERVDIANAIRASR